MPMIQALLGLEEMSKLDRRQVEMLKAEISQELRSNREIAEILRKRAQEALKTIHSAR